MNQQCSFFLTISIVDGVWKIVMKWWNKCCKNDSETIQNNSMPVL